MYNPPPIERALPLIEDIEQFLHSLGAPYDPWQPYQSEHITIAVATGQFYWKPWQYFVCWFMTDGEGIEDLREHIRPKILSSGNIMFVLECGCKDKKYMPEIRRKMRRHGKDGGVLWHRHGKGFKIFPYQRGLEYGQSR